MITWLALGAAALFPASAQTTIVGDGLVQDRLSVGTTTAGGRVLVQASSGTTLPLQIEGVDQTPFLRVENTGKTGIGIAPQAELDVWGVADSSDTGVQLRSGNLFPATTSYQLTFGYNGTSNLRHALRTLHSTATTSNEIEFLLWTPSVSTTAIGTLRVLALQTTAQGLTVQIDPFGQIADADLEVSNGSTLGGGSMLSGSEAVPSSRAFKTDISPLPEADQAAALQDVLGLKHVEYSYKRPWRWRPEPTRHRGLIFEEAPASVRGPGETIVFDERLTNAELAVKELMRRLDRLEDKAGRR